MWQDGYARIDVEGNRMSRPLAFLHSDFGRLGLVDMDSDLTVHVHPHLHVSMKVGGADTRFEVRGRAHPATEDTAILINAWEPHAWRRAAGAGQTLFLTLYLEPRWLADAGFRMPVEGVRSFFAAPCVALSPDARRAAATLTEAMVDPGTGSTGCGRARGSDGGGDMGDYVAALVYALRRDAGERGALTAAASDGARAFDYRIRRAFSALQTADGAVRLEDIARDVGLSRPRFFELFQECTGLTPSRVLNAARMERAIRLLTGGDSSMGDMALDLGFATPGNFSRFFKQQIGVTPMSFRRAAMPVPPGRTAGPDMAHP